MIQNLGSTIQDPESQLESQNRKEKRRIVNESQRLFLLYLGHVREAAVLAIGRVAPRNDTVTLALLRSCCLDKQCR